jgi:hypothetical protein
MDRISIHTREQMRTKAESLGMEVIFITKGATGRDQRLDKCTFGALQSKGKANRFAPEKSVQHPSPNLE